MADPKPSLDSLPLKAHAASLNFHYGDFQALKKIDMPIYDKRVTALIGPSGCGKSTFLRCFNRMHDLYPGNRYEGEIRMYPDNLDILAPKIDPIEVRMRISMVFQKPNPFPKTIFENVAYGMRVRNVTKKALLEEKVEEALRGAAQERGLELPTVTEFSAIKGRGVQAKQDGKKVYMGGPRLLESLELKPDGEIEAFGKAARAQLGNHHRMGIADAVPHARLFERRGHGPDLALRSRKGRGDLGQPLRALRRQAKARVRGDAHMAAGGFCSHKVCMALAQYA